jgi:hypothetical protein
VVPLVLALAGPAAAQDRPSPVIKGGDAIDGALVGGAVLVTALASLVPVDTSVGWQRELLPIDEAVKRDFSLGAKRTSDALLLGLFLGPFVLEATGGLDREAGRRALAYLESVTLGLALNAVTKVLVARPRPYVYNPDPAVGAYTTGRDSERERNGFKAAFAFMTRRYCILDEAATRQQVRSGAGFGGKDGDLGRCART